MTEVASWLGLGFTLFVGSLVTFGATIGIGRASRMTSLALCAVSIFGVWWFYATGVHFPTDAADWASSSRFIALVFLCAAIAGYTIGNLLGPFPAKAPLGVERHPTEAAEITLNEDSDGQPLVRVVGNRYINSSHGFALDHIGNWLVQELQPEFAAAGGFLAIDSPDRSATLNISAGPVDIAFFANDLAAESFLQQWMARGRTTFEDLRAQVHGAPVRQLEFRELDGERRVMRFEFAIARGRMGKLCALHHEREYVAYYTLGRLSFIDFEGVLQSWKWQPVMTS